MIKEAAVLFVAHVRVKVARARLRFWHWIVTRHDQVTRRKNDDARYH